MSQVSDHVGISDRAFFVLKYAKNFISVKNNRLFVEALPKRKSGGWYSVHAWRGGQVLN